MKKIFIPLIIIIYIIYAIAIFINNDFWVDIFSTAMTFFISGIIFYGYVYKQKIKCLKVFGIFLSLAVFLWFIVELWWIANAYFGCSDLVCAFFIRYGHSFTNIFLMAAVTALILRTTRNMDKIQMLLDTVVISACMAILIWVLVLEQDNTNFSIISSDTLFLITIIIDIVIFAWVWITIFSMRNLKTNVSKKIIICGLLVFTLTDFIAYINSIFGYLSPNSVIDGLYIISFTCFAGAAYKKRSELRNDVHEINSNLEYSKKGLEILILIAPAILFIFKREEIEYFILLILIFLIYYVMIIYTQKSRFQKKLLEAKEINVQELEKLVEERTKEITRILETDYVTGLFNRRYIETKLIEEDKKINENEKIYLLYIDINKSKALKQLYGKEIIENLFRNLGQMIKRILPENNAILGTYEDDVFVIMLKTEGDYVEAEKLSEEIVEHCKQVFLTDNHQILITIDIGISCYPEDTVVISELIRNAEVAMTLAKSQGIFRIQFYNDSIGDMLYSRNIMEMELKKVNFDNEFMLYFQPQVYIEKGELSGFESLIRWFKDGKFISPVDFIPIAEETGIIVSLGYWIIEQAAKQYVEWKSRINKDFRLSVNISVKQLVEKDFVEKMFQIINKYNIDPCFFEIEITETQQIEVDINMAEILNKIRSTGVQLALDDFGTGYSSLYYINNVPCDRIKMAKELIDNVENDAVTQAIIRMVIAIAKEKGIKVIAEGVELKSQWEALKELGCDEIQGYYFSKPLSAEEAYENWIKKI